MDDFKLYLPSNVSPDYFPNNTASDYQTQLQDPIRLEGQWEVGAESIAYTSTIGDRNEEANIDVRVKSKVSKLVNDLYEPSYILTEDNKWKGLLYFTEKPNITVTRPQIVELLNSCNAKILKDGKAEIFHFDILPYGQHFQLRCQVYYDDIIVVISRILAKHLGLFNVNTFSGKGTRFAHGLIRNTWMNKLEKIDHGECYIRYLNMNLVKKEDQIVLKYPGELFDGPTFVKKWEERVFKKFPIRAEYKKQKIIIDNHTNDYVYFFSPNLAMASEHRTPFTYRITLWAPRAYNNQDTTFQTWTVDVYGKTLETTLVDDWVSLPLTIYPRHHTVESAMSLIRGHYEKELTSLLRKKPEFSDPNLQIISAYNHFVLILTSDIQLKWSENLASMFGFDECEFKEGWYMSTKLPTTLDQRDQHMFITSDIIMPVSYGNEQRYILQDFVHDKKGDDKIIEKRFQPISYVAVSRNFINSITIRLVNELFHPVTLKDAKTVLILHFRKVK